MTSQTHTTQVLTLLKPREMNLQHLNFLCSGSSRTQRHNVKYISSYRDYRDSPGLPPLAQVKALNLVYIDLGTMKLKFKYHGVITTASRVKGGSLPENKDLSPLHFMVGFLGCIQEETINTVRDSMLEYGRHLFQDAIETN